MSEDGAGATTTPAWVKILWLLLLALAVRLGVVVAATAFGPEGSLGDLVFHSRLVTDPIGHLRNPSPEVTQYAPFLGMLEWITVKPWLAMGMGMATALRLGSITWDLIGMALLLAATHRRFPDKLVFVGLMWAVSPMLWPASAYSAQDELIAAAVVSLVVLLLFLHKRTTAVIVCVVALFAVKILLAPILLAVLLTARRGTRGRMWASAGAALVVSAAFTWMVSGGDGLSRQTGYSVDVIGFSISAWSALYLHQYVSAATAIRLSILAVGAGLTLAVWLWSRHRVEEVLEGPRLAAGLMMVVLALLAISNPEYLCIAAPVAIIGCIGLGPLYQGVLLVLASGVAWAINGVYYFLRVEYDPTGSRLGIDGFAVPVGRTVHLLDATHQAFLVLFLYLAVMLARNYLLGPDRLQRAEAARLARLSG